MGRGPDSCENQRCREYPLDARQCAESYGKKDHRVAAEAPAQAHPVATFVARSVGVRLLVVGAVRECDQALHKHDGATRRSSAGIQPVEGSAQAVGGRDLQLVREAPSIVYRCRGRAFRSLKVPKYEEGA